MNPLTSHSLLVAAVLLPAALAHGKPTPEEENRVAYGGLREKGVRREEVLANGGDRFKPERERPSVRYLAQRELPHPDKKGSAVKESVVIRVVERAGVDQEAALISFGLPFAQGAIYRLSDICLIDPAKEGEFIPLQRHVLTLWPDGSIKSALLQFSTDLVARKEKEVRVEFGKDIKPGRTADVAGVKIRREKEQWHMNTGAIEVAVSSVAFAPPGNVRAVGGKQPVIAKGEGIAITSEDGTVFSSITAPLESLIVEREGPLETVLRAEGVFQSKDGGKLMRHISRLRFIQGSSKVEVTITVINDALEREFTDIRSLALNVALPGMSEGTAELFTGKGPLTGKGLLSLVQWDELTQEAKWGEGETALNDERAPGAAAVQSGGKTLHFAYKDFWQRWPKGLTLNPGRLSVELLPQQVKPLEQGLPVHLQFPFVEGCYRTKWGTAFTERMVFDFAAKDTAKADNLSAAYQAPALVVIPPAYLAGTRALLPLPTQSGERLSRWLSYVDGAMKRFLEHRDEARQYGYLNWGDWYGERGRNWGNNEYDIPHGFFMQYLLTGEGQYLDAAVQGVRHQADVDIVHAYPNRFYVGANVQHSIGHSGISYQTVIPKTWTYQYDYASSATNGHTWADGMADSWLLTGDPVVMESMLSLAEHIRWAAVPQFKSMGNHHRSAGWSSVAAAATYRATSDPEYLEGLRKISEIPLTQWDPHTGIWPYPLHPGHTGGREGLIGASVYNMGILLTGISRYHELTGDPKAVAVMDGAAKWLLKCWKEERAWPYSALADGSLFRPNLSPNLNPLIYPSLAYIGKITGKAEYSRIAEKAYDVTFGHQINEVLPKEFSIKMYGTAWALASMESAPQAEESESPTAASSHPEQP